MAITYPLDFPTAPGIRAIEWLKDVSVSRSDSPFSLGQKFYDWGGKRWRAHIELPPMTVTQARTWEAWFLSLNGPVGTFWLTPTLDKTAIGVATGTPLVNGASQTGQSIVTDGWTPSQTGILKAGDWMQIGNCIYRVLQDANSDGGGNATFDIWPSLRASPGDDDTITVTDPKGLFRLSEMPGMNIAASYFVEGTKFEAVEAV